MQDPPTGPESPVFGFLRAVLDFPKPLVAAIQGYAIGIGTTVLLHCDLAYADTSAVFQMPFVNLALVPEAASSLLLPRDIGMRRASELLLLGERFSAQRAHRDGLINDVWAPEDFEANLHHKLELLASRPPTSMRMSKKLLRDRDREDTYHVMVEEGRYFVERLASPEFMQVVQSIINKKKK
jgi:enoyl-CoA hydratase/carnithine racemase